MLGKLLILVLLIAGVITWVVHSPLTRADTVRESQQLVATEESVPFIAEGIVMRYQSSSVPVFYLLYETREHRFKRKELRFTHERGCTPGAGDLPCVYPGDTNAPPVPIGTHVRITGLLDAQRIIVDEIVPTEDRDGDFAVVTAGIGEEVRSGDVIVRPLDVYSGGPCELGLGCYRDGIPRVSFAVRIGDRSFETKLVPGMFEDVPDGVIVLLAADEVSGEATFVIAHGESR